MDVFDKTKRSQVMSRIKGKDTKSEIKVRKWLFSHGLRYRKNVSSLPGKPDIVLPKYKTVVFIHGCFWHGHEINCTDSHIPKTRTEYWNNKISKNKSRDLLNTGKLSTMGWKVITI